jgi:hypothetical protein
LPQSVLECRNADLPFRIVSAERRERPDAPHPLALLRARRHGPRCRSAKNTEKLPTPHARSQAQETASYRLKRSL